MKRVAVFLVLFACISGASDQPISDQADGDIDQAQRIVFYKDGSWFIPANSGKGPPLSQVKTFTLRDGTQCENLVKRLGDRKEGLLCRKASG